MSSLHWGPGPLILRGSDRIMEAVGSSEMLVTFYLTTQHHIPDDHKKIIITCCHKNFKPHIRRQVPTSQNKKTKVLQSE
jgi:hypothetical protein